jgi:hypothetical protein
VIEAIRSGDLENLRRMPGANTDLGGATIMQRSAQRRLRRVCIGKNGSNGARLAAGNAIALSLPRCGRWLPWGWDRTELLQQAEAIGLNPLLCYFAIGKVEDVERRHRDSFASCR